MNIKYTVQNQDSKRVVSCIVDGEKDLERQFEEVFQIAHGHGIGVFVRENEIELTDYYHASSMAGFDILSREETTEPIHLEWTVVEAQE